jgi:hypothetical protein
MALGSTQPLTEMSTRNISWGVNAVRRADNLTTCMCRLSRNLGASTSWNPVGLSRPVMGLLYLFFLPFYICRENRHYLTCWAQCMYDLILTFNKSKFFPKTRFTNLM